MTGPEHYRAAEEALESALESRHPRDTANALRLAQVHATLAAVAASVANDHERRVWSEMCGIPLPSQVGW